MDEKSFDDLFNKHLGLNSKKKEEINEKSFTEQINSYLEGYTHLDKNKNSPDGSKHTYKKNFKNIIPEKTLDLHNNTRIEASYLIDSFITSALASNFKILLVITGKGLHSDSGPVLKEFAYSRLNDMAAVRLVKDSPRKLGGTGALLVFLR